MKKREGGGSRYKLPGPDGPEESVGPEYIAYFFVYPGSAIICRLYTMALSDATEVTLQLFSEKMFSPSALPGEPGKKYFCWGLNPLSSPLFSSSNLPQGSTIMIVNKDRNKVVIYISNLQ